MMRAVRCALAAAALLALGACASGPLQLASCRLDAPGPRSTAALEFVASDRGLGGSGISTSDRGIGGSGMRAGIIGVITGFASLCVNGYEIELDESSVVTVEGNPAREADLHLGQLVVIEAEAVGGTLRAASIDVRLAALGPVSSISADRKTLTLLGQTVRLTEPGARAHTITVGDWVAVSGLRGADAVIEGTSVVRLPQAGMRAMVAGPLRESRSAGLEIGGLAIAKPGFAAGDAVVVAGRPVEGRLAVEDIRPQLEARFTASVRDLSVQTFVPAERLMGLRIAPTEMRPATPGSPVQLEGRLARGTFVPHRAMIPVLPRDGASAVRNVIVDRGVILRPFTPPDTVLPTLVRPPEVTPPTTPERPQPPPS
ncbi:MAG: DUF5666 domain-containing protein [Rhodospirillaceae bacterium]